MNWKKHLSLIIGGAICVVLLTASVVLLILEQRSFARSAGELQAAKERLDKLNKRIPAFPSAANIEAAKTNRDEVARRFEQLNAELLKGRINAPPVEPAQFQNILEATLNRLRAVTNGQISLPPQFSFGFERYAQGELPTTDTVARLVRQLKLVELMCGILVDAKVASIDGVGRDPFDAASARVGETGGRPALAMTMDMGGAGGRAGAAIVLPPPETNELYAVERLQLAFSGPEGVVWQVLNTMARHAGCFVVAHVDLANELGVEAKEVAKKFVPVAAAGESRGPAVAPTAAALATREERVVSGRENLRATVVVDAYQFAPPPAKEGAT